MKNILYFSPISWSDLKQRPQYFAEELSKEYNIIYVSPSLSIFNLRKGALAPFSFLKKKKRGKKLLEITPNGILNIPKRLEKLDFFNWNEKYFKIQFKDILDQIDYIWLGSPLYYNLIKSFNKPVIYDKMDDHKELINSVFMKKIIENYEKKIVNKSNAIIVSSEALKENLKRHKNIFLIRNGVATEIVQKKEKNNIQINEHILKLKKHNQKIFGYVGTIDEWFDLEVIKEIVNKNKNNHIFLIGNNNIQKIEHNNIHYYKAIPKLELISVMKIFDYALYNFKKNKFLDTINPVKMYEYLALGIDTIAIKSKETSMFSKNVYMYEDKNSLLRKLNDIENNIKVEEKLNLEDFVIENSWEIRGREIIKIVNNL